MAAAEYSLKRKRDDNREMQQSVCSSSNLSLSTNTNLVLRSEIPSATTMWSDVQCLSKLRVKIAAGTFPSSEIFYSFPQFFANMDRTSAVLSALEIHRKEQNDRLAYYRRALKHVMDLNYESVELIPLCVLEALYMKIESEISNIDKHTRSKAEFQYLKESDLDEYNIRLKILKTTKQFVCQLIYMVEVTIKNLGKENFHLPDGMYQELFVRFAKIFDLEIMNGSNVLECELQVTGEKVSSTPSGIVYYPLRGKNSILAVLEVTKDGSKYDDDETERTHGRAKRKFTTAIHVDSSLKAQHVCTMLSVLSQSIFGNRGIFGFAVQGTEVAMVALDAKENYLDYLQTGKFPSESYMGVNVKYSEKCNILTTAGRLALVDALFNMTELHKLLE